MSEISAEVHRLEESATYSGQSQFEQAKLWRGVNLVLGVPSAALAAVSGATGFAGVAGRVPAAIMALVASGLAAVLTTLNASRRASQAHASATAYLALQADLRQLRLIDFGQLTLQEARAELDEFTGRWKEINASSDPPSFYAYARGRNNIEKGRQRYEVDAHDPKGLPNEELDRATVDPSPNDG